MVKRFYKLIGMATCLGALTFSHAVQAEDAGAFDLAAIARSELPTAPSVCTYEQRVDAPNMPCSQCDNFGETCSPPYESDDSDDYGTGTTFSGGGATDDDDDDEDDDDEGGGQ